jgi:hypothetical protein
LECPKESEKIMPPKARWVKKECPVCHKEFEVKPSHSELRVCCSRRCYSKLMSERSKGENNPFYGRQHKQLSKDLVSAANTGRPQSEETRRRRSETHKLIPHTKEWTENQGKALKGREITWADKISESRVGYKVPLNERQARSEFSRGSSNPAYLHGLSPVQLSVRKSMRYRDWRTAVYTRDNFTDQITGEPINGRGNAHHREPFSKIWEDNKIKTFEDAMKCDALWNIDNGVTMKNKTHNRYHKVFDLSSQSISGGMRREKYFRKRYNKIRW